MIDMESRTLISMVLFADIAGYSLEPFSRQIAIKSRLNALIAAGSQANGMADLIVVDTGDGAALCFSGDPEEVIRTATRLRDEARAPGGENVFNLRIGVNLGPVRILPDVNDRPNVIGDGINAAQRIMSFAEPGQILASRAFYDVAACLSPDNPGLFRFRGLRRDKHDREYEVYEVTGGLPSPAEPAAKFDNTHLASLERCLTRHLGPIARVLVKRASAKAADLAALCQVLGEAIPHDGARTEFLAEIRSLMPDLPAPDARPASLPVPQSPFVLDRETSARLEHLLARYVGPLARLLVQKAAAEASSFADLRDRLAAHIDSEPERATFLNALDQAS